MVLEVAMNAKGCQGYQYTETLAIFEDPPFYPKVAKAIFKGRQPKTSLLAQEPKGRQYSSKVAKEYVLARARDGEQRSDTMSENIYLRMPLAQVRSDAIHGVSLAIEAWRTRDPAAAARELHPTIEPGREREQLELRRRILDAVGDYQKRTGLRSKQSQRKGPAAGR
jgi:hypothetical protein